MSDAYSHGDIVEITKTGAAFGRPKGSRFEVTDYFEGFKPGDDEYGDDGFMQGPIVDGIDERGSVEVEAEHVRLVHRADAVPRPTAQEFAKALGLGSLRSDFEQDVTEYEDGTAYITFVDKRSGLSWTAVVRVASIERAS